MVRTQVQLTAEQAEAVKRLAAEHGVSAAEIIRRSIDAFVRSPGSPSQAETRSRALLAAGMLSGRPRDLSVDHDRYVAEAFER